MFNMGVLLLNFYFFINYSVNLLATNITAAFLTYKITELVDMVTIIPVGVE